MGDGGRLAGRAALDEMERMVADMLAAVADPPPADEPPAARAAVAERTPPLPDLGELDRLLAGAEAGWADWRRRLERLTAGLP